jgi:paired amphipathic helix protein Sin3a
VRLFKRDDLTFEFDQLDKVKRWRAYVASYMAVEPTEGLEIARLSYPYLKQRLAKTEDADEGNVFEDIKHQDKITVSISPAMYTMKFIASEPSGNGGIQYFVHPKNAAVGSVSMSSPEKLRESWFQNVSWMKDSSQEDVEAHKIAHKKEMDDDRTGEKETEVGDVDMAEA